MGEILCLNLKKFEEALQYEKLNNITEEDNSVEKNKT